MKKIFLDIGAYIGDTASVVIKYAFDEIHCFEPVKVNNNKIKKKFNDKKIILHEYGLWNETCEQLIYGAGNIGSSIFKEKKTTSDVTESCKFVKASSWFKENITNEDYVIAKINIEGAEIAVLNDLIDSGEYQKINHILISFDIDKVFGKEHEKAEMLLKFHKNNIFNYFISGQMKYIVRRMRSKERKRYHSDHAEVVGLWLDVIGETK